MLWLCSAALLCFPDGVGSVGYFFKDKDTVGFDLVFFKIYFSLFMSNINQFVDAARDGDYEVVCSLLSRGININEKNSY